MNRNSGPEGPNFDSSFRPRVFRLIAALGIYTRISNLRIPTATYLGFAAGLFLLQETLYILRRVLRGGTRRRDSGEELAGETRGRDSGEELGKETRVRYSREGLEERLG